MERCYVDLVVATVTWYTQGMVLAIEFLVLEHCLYLTMHHNTRKQNDMSERANLAFPMHPIRVREDRAENITARS